MDTHGTRLAPGEKLNRKRMASVAAAYGLEAREHTLPFEGNPFGGF
jgi:hypothetical protein